MLLRRTTIFTLILALGCATIPAPAGAVTTGAEVEQAKGVDKEILEQYQNDLKIAQAHIAAGTKPKYDVTKAQTQVSQAQLQLIKAENGVSLAKTALSVLMNTPGRNWCARPPTPT